MRFASKLRAAAGAIARRRMRRQADAFLASTANCRRTQTEVFQRLVELNAASQFHREYGLSGVRNPRDIRKILPVTNYQFFKPYIDELKIGNSAALLGPNNRLLMFSLSSGTTSDSKYIPITSQFLADYRRGWQIWGIRAFDDHPAANVKNIVQLSSDFDRFRSASGTPCGNISGLAAAMQRRVVRFMYSIPATVAKISDPDAKYYAALRLAIADPNVGMVTTANPSTLVQMAKSADADREEIIRDIYDGTLSRKYPIDDVVRRRLKSRCGRPNRKRARELEAIIARTGQFLPRDYWANLDIVAVWTGGSCAAYLDTLRDAYGDVAVRDHGLSASEGRMTIPLSDHCSEGVLDISSHYFEFIPEGQYGHDNPTILEAHELEVDENYFILLTTASGFFRYDICDVVRCVDFRGTTPVLRFLHKGAHIANITGEKISESQVVEAVRLCTDEMQIRLQYFTAIPTWAETPRYQLMIEEGDLPSIVDADRLAVDVDLHLQKLNCEYREKRQSGRLAAMTSLPLPVGTWKKMARQRLARLGGSAEQYKHPCLIPDIEAAAKLTQEFLGVSCLPLPR